MAPYSLKKDNLYQQLRQEILTGKYPDGLKLPKELDFSRELGVAKVTLRSALEKLETDGLVARLPGKGTFISRKTVSNRVLVVVVRSSKLELPQNYILPGLEAAAAESGLETELCYIEYLRKLKPENALQILREKKLCGIILITSSCLPDDPEIVLFKELDIPLVITHGVYQDRLLGTALIYTDLRRAFQDGLKYLAEKGHRQVKILGMKHGNLRGWPEEEFPGLFRLLGLNDQGTLVYFSAEFERGFIRRCVDRILADGVPTAILCYSDFFAIEVMEYLQEKGFRIPDDIAVMGFCGYPGGTFLEPPLSTVDFGYAGIGRLAVELVSSAQGWFKVPNVAPPVLLAPYQLVERDSTRIERRENYFANQILQQYYVEEK